MSATTAAATEVEPRIVMDRISYAQYEAINDAIVDRHNPRMIYAAGTLVLLHTSRLHGWFAGLFGYLVAEVASGCRFDWETGGQATYRHPDLEVGIEGDRVFYLGESAEVMRGPREIDLTTQPRPDLAIEVEHTHPARAAMIAWGRIGVPEVWRFDVKTRTASFWLRQEDGTYEATDRSAGLPVLRPDDVTEQLRRAETLGSTSLWHAQLGDWVRQTLLPRLDEPS